MRKLCRGAHENIIELYGDGELRNSTYHFIDMELCDFDLKEYIDSKLHTEGHTRVPKISTNYNQSSWLGASEIWKIISQIANGVAFIHNHREVHRDLKPRNGKCHHI